MAFENFDLNLLKTLLVLLQEKNTVKAAERLGVSQPAVSRSLSKIRTHFNDPIFVRQPRGLALTLRGIELEAELPSILSMLENTLEGHEFNPRKLSGKLSIAMNSYLSDSHGYEICENIMRDAPNVELELHNYNADTERLLINQEVDAGLSFYPLNSSKELRQIPISRTLIVGICSVEHPLANSAVGIEELATLPITGLIIPEFNAHFMQLQSLLSTKIKLKPQFRSQHLGPLYKYIKENNAICIGPKSALNSLDNNDFTFINITNSEQALALQISLNFNKNLFRSGKYLWLEKLCREALLAQ